MDQTTPEPIPDPAYNITDLYPDTSEEGIYYFREPRSSDYGSQVHENSGNIPVIDETWKTYNPPLYYKYESAFPLRADRFILEILNYPNINYHVTMIDTGNILLPRVEVPNLNLYRGIGAAKIKTENLKFTFIVDDQLKNYNTIIDWMNEALRGYHSDLIIWCYDSCDNNKLVGYFSYKGAFPVFLSGIEFKTNSEDLMLDSNAVIASVELSIDKQEVILLQYKPFDTPPSDSPPLSNIP